MNCIQNTYLNTSSYFNKAIAGVGLVCAITVIAIAIIGLTARSAGSLSGLVQVGAKTHGILLGTSLVVLTLDLLWIALLNRKKFQLTLKSKPFLVNRSTHGSAPSPASFIPKIEGTKNVDSAEDLPAEVICEIFSFMSPEELPICALVSKKWKELALSDTVWNKFCLKKLSPLLTVFDEQDWIDYTQLSSSGLTVDDVSSEDNRIDNRKLFSFLKRYASTIEGNSGFTLVTIPKGLTFDKVRELAASLESTLSSKLIARICVDAFGGKNFHDTPVDKTYRVIVTNNIFKKSRELSSHDQEELVRKLGFEMLTVLEVFTLLVVIFMTTEKRLYHDKPWTSTRCLKEPHYSPLVVGSFGPEGLIVDFDRVTTFINYGVGGALRNFQNLTVQAKEDDMR